MQRLAMRDEISLRTEVQREQPGNIEGFFFFYPAVNILLVAVDSTAIPAAGGLIVLFSSSGRGSVVCFGSAAASVLAFLGFSAWLASGSSSSA